MRLRRFDPSQPPPYFIALIGIIAVILLSAGRGESNPIGALALLVQGVVLIFVLRISGVGGSAARIATGVTAVLVVLGVASILIEGEAATLSSEVVGLLFAVVTPLVIIRRVMQESHVDATVVGGALCVYLLIGLFYVQVFTISDRAVDGQFFAQVTDPTPSDFAYFSYVTMTTVGYGDLTAAGNLDRMFAVTEALIGQLYLVTVVALAVSRVRPGERRRPLADARDASEDDGTEAEP